MIKFDKFDELVIGAHQVVCGTPSSSSLSRLNTSPRRSRRRFLAKKSGSPYSVNPRVYINPSPRLTLRWSSVNLRWSESPVQHRKLVDRCNVREVQFLVISTIGGGPSSMAEVQGKVHVADRCFTGRFGVCFQLQFAIGAVGGRANVNEHFGLDRTISAGEISRVKVFRESSMCEQSFWQQFKDQT